MSLDHKVNNVANGRRLAARKIAMNTPATVHAQVYSKRIVYDNDTDPNVPEDKLSFEAIAVSKQDEPSYEYDYKGMACLLFDRFTGGIVHKNYDDNIPTEQALISQIEPYDISYQTLAEQIINVPEWRIAEGDILGLMIYDDFMVWYEVVSFTGQSVMADFGIKYVLNRRDQLMQDPVLAEFNSREEV